MSAWMEMLRGVVVPAVLDAAEPGAALARAWGVLPGEPRRVVLAGFGKGSAAMARVAVELLGERLDRGLVVCRAEHLGMVPTAGGRVRAVAADHPMPTERNVEAALELSGLVGGVRADELLLVLVSGGGSAQLSSPREGLTLEDVAGLTDGLLRSGATIDEINCVRKHCEGVKGGQLARLPGGAEVCVFVLSDVLGDPLDVISSGPFAADPTTFADAAGVMERRGLAVRHGAVMALLRRGMGGEIEETPKPGDGVFARVRHHVIANNGGALEAAAVSLRGLGYEVVEVRTGLVGEAAEVGRALAERVRGLGCGEAAVWGGETTVTVGDAAGKGGRNQELALAAAVALDGAGGAAMSLATDGVDGPTDAAGGVVDGASAGLMRAAGVDAAAALAGHDSWRALAACGGLIEIGATGTNVNDVMVGVREHA